MTDDNNAAIDAIQIDEEILTPILSDEASIAMNDDTNTAAGLDQADEEILSYTVSDEALEAAAGTERGVLQHIDNTLAFSWRQGGQLCC
jgi:hypothetical protein